MAQHAIYETRTFSANVISEGLFGVNFVTSFSFEIPKDEALVALLEELDVTTLRFPGGSATEHYFAQEAFLTENFDAATHTDSLGKTHNLTPMSDFFSVAGSIAADVKLVIPTQVAFEQSAGQAILSGTYGNRTEIDARFLGHLDAFVTEALAQAALNGIEITHFELGNEFWGSGLMTAGEYGYIASILAQHLEDNYPDIDIIVQATWAAGFASPKEADHIYVQPLGNGEYHAHNPQGFAELPEGWIKKVIPGQGNAATQTQAIADALVDANVADLIDGVVGHVYFTDGFEKVDGSRDFALSDTFDNFENRLGQTGLERHITEWSGNQKNAAGLQYAQLTVEGFFELTSNGVTDSNFWPLTFANPNIDGRALLDQSEGDHTFGGVIFQWLNEATVGLQPVFDYEIPDDIDIHGFGETNRLVVFAGDRSGTDRLGPIGDGVRLELGDFALDDNFFVVLSHLGETGDTGISNQADPVLTYSDGVTSFGREIAFDLDAWGLQRIEMTSITSGADSIMGRDGNDRIEGRDGNDTLNGDGGDDTLIGGGGDDFIIGGIGDDEIRGGINFDDIYAGEGDDTVWGDHGRDVIYLEAGNDVFNDNGQDNLNGDDFVDGGDGNDTLNGDGGDDTLIGGGGDDFIIGGIGDDLLSGGGGADVFIFNDGFDRDEISDFETSAHGDILDLTGLTAITSYPDLIDQNHLYQLGADAIIDDGQGTSIILANVGLGALDAGHFLF